MKAVQDPQPQAARGQTAWLPLVWAFLLWFAHFMLCWVAVEIWPRQWQANAVAWAATPLALLALAWHWQRLRVRPRPGEQARWVRGVGLGATAIAGVAVLFGAVPSLVFLP